MCETLRKSTAKKLAHGVRIPQLSEASEQALALRFGVREMSNESNWAAKQGAQFPGYGADYFKTNRGMSDSQAADAAAAAARAKAATSKS